MNRKRVVALIASTMMVVSLFSGCASSSTPKTATSTTKKIVIGLSTDQGGLNDKSFNQAADTGIKKAQKEFSLDYKALESKVKEDYQPNLEALVNNKSDLVFGVGYQMEQAFTDTAKKYTTNNFVIIDDVVALPNVESITFKEQEGSFLMGVIAGKTTKTNKVGFIGGIDGALINKFEAGFAAGVKSVNPTAAAGLISKDGKTPGTMVKYAGSFTDANLGYEDAKSLYSSGCDVVYHAAGGVGLGLFKAAKEMKDAGKADWAIGVDMDQAVTVPEYASVILSSMIKRVDTATYEACKDEVNKSFKGGKHIELGLKEDGVGIAPTSSVNTSKDVLDLVKKYQDAIISGKIVVPSTRDKVASFVVPTI